MCIEAELSVVGFEYMATIPTFDVPLLAVLTGRAFWVTIQLYPRRAFPCLYHESNEQLMVISVITLILLANCTSQIWS